MKRIDVSGPLNEDLATRVIDKIRSAGKQPVDLRIDSPGGSFGAAVLIALEMEEHVAPIFTTITGFAGSAAGLLAIAGDRRRVDHRGQLMLHYPTPASAEAGREMRQIVGEFARQAVPRDILRWLALEKIFAADEAVSAGLVDTVIDARSREPVRLRLPPKRRPAAWLAPYRELAENYDLRPRLSI